MAIRKLLARKLHEMGYYPSAEKESNKKKQEMIEALSTLTAMVRESNTKR